MKWENIFDTMPNKKKILWFL